MNEFSEMNDIQKQRRWQVRTYNHILQKMIIVNIYKDYFIDGIDKIKWRTNELTQQQNLKKIKSCIKQKQKDKKKTKIWIHTIIKCTQNIPW